MKRSYQTKFHIAGSDLTVDHFIFPNLFLSQATPRLSLSPGSDPVRASSITLNSSN